MTAVGDQLRRAASDVRTAMIRRRENLAQIRKNIDHLRATQIALVKRERDLSREIDIVRREIHDIHTSIDKEQKLLGSVQDDVNGLESQIGDLEKQAIEADKNVTPEV